jgi:hypothetical protein
VPLEYINGKFGSHKEETLMARGLVQYFVMKRPKHPITGEIVRGKTAGATRNPDGSVNVGSTLWYAKNDTSPGTNGTLMSTTAPLTTVGASADAAQVDGEPWILHSTHFSVEDAVDAAKPVISAVGSENVKILKSIAHELIVKLA